MWYLIAFLLYLLLPAHGFVGAFFCGFLGRIYIAYFLIRHWKTLRVFVEDLMKYLSQ